MAIVERNLNNINIFAIEGVLGVGQDDRLADRVRGRIGEGIRHFVFDLTRVPHVDSTGIAALISSYVTITNAGGRLILVGLDPRVRRVLDVTRLLTIFEHQECEAEAIARLSVPPAA